jgi:hypothetical protein
MLAGRVRVGTRRGGRFREDLNLDVVGVLMLAVELANAYSLTMRKVTVRLLGW